MAGAGRIVPRRLRHVPRRGLDASPDARVGGRRGHPRLGEAVPGAPPVRCPVSLSGIRYGPDLADLRAALRRARARWRRALVAGFPRAMTRRQARRLRRESERLDAVERYARRQARLCPYCGEMDDPPEVARPCLACVYEGRVPEGAPLRPWYSGRRRCSTADLVSAVRRLGHREGVEATRFVDGLDGSTLTLPDLLRRLYPRQGRAVERSLAGRREAFRRVVDYNLERRPARWLGEALGL